MRATIIANGNISNLKIETPADALLIAADGGGRHCLKLGLYPQVVIGDFDSLTEEELTDLGSQGAELIRYPANKDETDLELALDYALERGVTKITLYGLLGGRWDMTFSNIMLLASSRYSGIQFWVIEGNTEMFILRGSENIELHGQPGDTVSVIPLNGDVQGLTYTGLQWPLEDAALPFGTPRGVSNRLSGRKARIILNEGVALVVVIHS